MYFHVPTDMFMPCACSSIHKLLGLYPHQLCETTSFSSCHEYQEWIFSNYWHCINCIMQIKIPVPGM
jgi:hypothetical protein